VPFCTSDSCALPAVQLGHHDVEQDEVGLEVREQRQRLLAVRGHLDRVALQLEVDLEQLLDDLVVVHDKDARIGHADKT
jgi:hypothetical protein